MTGLAERRRANPTKSKNIGRDETAVSAPVSVILIVILTITLVAVAVPQFWQFIAGLIWPNLASIDAEIIETTGGGQAIEVIHRAGERFSLGTGEDDQTLPVIAIECQRPDGSMTRAVPAPGLNITLFTPGTCIYLFTYPGQDVYMTGDRDSIPEGVLLTTGTWRIAAVDEENQIMIAEKYLTVGASNTSTSTQTATATSTTTTTATPLPAVLTPAALAAVPLLRKRD